MYKAVNTIRANKLTVDCKLFTEEVLCLQSERANALYNLYDMGASYSPSSLDMKELFEFLMEQSQNDCGYLITRDGFIPWTFEMIDYALFKAKDETFKKVLQFFEIYKYCDEQLKQLYSVTTSSVRRLSSVAIGSTKIIKDISANVSITTDRLCYSNRYLAITALRDCLARNQNTRIVDIDLRGDFLKGLAVALGIPKEEAERHEYENKSMFVRGITFEEEKYIIRGIADGSIVSDGEFSRPLEVALAKERDLRNSMGDMATSTESMISVKSKMFIEGIEFTLSTLRKFEKENERFGFRYIWVDEDFITAEVNNGFITSEDKIIAFRPRRKIGHFAKDYVTGENLHETNLMKGICGEYITESECERRGYIVTGLPVQIITNVHTVQSGGTNGVIMDYTTDKYYSILDIKYSRSGKKVTASEDSNISDDYDLCAIEPKMGSLTEVTPSSLEKTYKFFGVSSFDELMSKLYYYDKIHLFYKNATNLNEQDYKTLVVTILINYILAKVVVFDVKYLPLATIDDSVLVNATADALVAFGAIYKG